MTVLGSQWLGSAGAAEFDPETIGNSIWLDGSADYMGRQNGSGFADGKKAIFSFWIQRSKFGAQQAVFGSIDAGTGFIIQFDGGDAFWIYSNGATSQYITNRKFRDTGWYHIIVSFDTTESVAADRIKIWVNGVEETSFSTQTTLALNDADFGISLAQTGSSVMRLGAYNNTSANYYYWNGYIAQMCMLESNSIQNGDFAVSDFLDTFDMGTNGSQFIPKADADIAALATSAGGNSFCLDFAASADLGNDISSNNEDWTPTSMAAANQSGSTPSKEYAVWNPLDEWIGTSAYADLVLGNGSLKCTSGNGSGVKSTFNLPDGSWYSEHTCTTVLTNQCIGIATPAALLGGIAYTNIVNTWAYNVGSGKKNEGTVETAEGDIFSNGDILGLAVTKSGSTINIWYARNNTWQSGNPSTGATPTTTATITEDIFFVIRLTNGGTRETNSNFGQQTFSYTPPTDFLALGSSNLPTTEYQGVDYFKPLLYAGNGTAIGSGGKAVTGTGFQPDFTWIKNRDALDDHSLYDSVRGVTKQIETNNQDDETTEAESLTTFGTDGFTVGSLAQVNTNTENYVSYSWAAGGSSSSNGSGSITSTVTAADAGHFSIVNWTGNTTLGATVGHGLGGTPEFIIAFNRSTDNENRPVYHKFMTSDHDHLKINEANATSVAGSSIWDVSGMSSTLIGLGNAIQSNGSTATNCMIAYAFRSIPGVCKVGNYYGNNVVDGPFVWTGFKVVYLFLKNIGTTNPWMMYDSARDTYNPTVRYLHPNSTAAGASGAGTRDIDFLSNGFKLRENDSDINSTSSNQYVYVAMGSLGGNGTLPPIYGQ